MPSFNINQLLPIFLDKSGEPLNGQVWIGTINQNPINNPVNVYYDSALTILAPNPLKVSSGKIVRNGTPAQIYVNSAFSAVVKDNDGVFIESIDNSDANLDALVQLAGDNGASLIGYQSSLTNSVQTTLRTIIENGNDYLHRVYGAIGDGVADDTLAFNRCAAAGYPIIGKIGSVYKTTDTIYLRKVFVNLEGCTINLVHGNIGVQAGGNALTRPNIPQYFGDIVRGAGQATTEPQLEIRGAKGQTISTIGVDWIRIWAEYVVDSGQSYSTAYSKFHLNGCKTLDLRAATTNQGWINENDFYFNDIKTVNIIGSTVYTFNHNRFHGGTWEADATVYPIVEINLDYASSNIFYNIRAEANADVTGLSHKVKFGITPDAICFNNEIVVTRVSSEFNFFPDGLPSYFEITRNNVETGNSVRYGAGDKYRKNLVAYSSIFDSSFNNNNVIGSFHRFKTPHTKYLRCSAAYYNLCLSDFFPVEVDDILYFSYTTDQPTTTRYKCFVEFFDKYQKPVTADATFLKSSTIQSLSGNALLSNDVLSGQYARVTKEALAGGVAFVRVSVIQPSTLAYSIAQRVQVQHLSLSRSLNNSIPIQHVPLVTAIPTQSVARKWFKVYNSSTGVVYTNTLDVRPVTTATVSSGNTLTVDSTSGMNASGDLIAVCLDNDTMFHTTSTAITATTITTTDAIPSSITSGALVVANKWV